MFEPLDKKSLSIQSNDSDIGPNDWKILSKFWHPVALVTEVTDKPFAATLLDVDIVLYKSGDGITAALDMCPHRWVKLSIGTVENGSITCPFHGLSFGGDGKCNRVPALGGKTSKLPANYKVQTFRTQLRYGMIWVCLDDESLLDIPEFPALKGYDDSAIMFVSVWQWPISAVRQVENFIDLGHLPFIHATTLGGDPLGKLKPAKVEHLDSSVMCRARFVETVPYDEPTECEFDYHVFLPFAVDFYTRPVDETKGAGFKSVDIASPTSAYSCRVFQFMTRGEPGQIFSEGDTEGVFSFDDKNGPGVINQQDIDVLKHLANKNTPLDEKLEIHLPVDNNVAAYRKRLREFGLGRK